MAGMLDDPLSEPIRDILRSGVLSNIEEDALPNVNGLILLCRMLPPQFLRYEPTLLELEREIRKYYGCEED